MKLFRLAPVLLLAIYSVVLVGIELRIQGIKTEGVRQASLPFRSSGGD